MNLQKIVISLISDGNQFSFIFLLPAILSDHKETLMKGMRICIH